jgi:hypothetical protein
MAVPSERLVSLSRDACFHANGGARFAGAMGRPDIVPLVIRSRSGCDAIVAASPPVTRIG